MVKYTIRKEDEDYIDLRIKKSKQEIIKTFVLSFLIPILFLTLKTSFFKKDINELMIIVCMGMAILGLLTMVRISIKRLNTFKKIIKEVTLDREGNITFSTISGVYVNEKIINFKLHEGYNGSIKMKDIFDMEFTYRVENYQKGLQFYLISSYFEYWEDLKTTFSK